MRVEKAFPLVGKSMCLMVGFDSLRHVVQFDFWHSGVLSPFICQDEVRIKRT